MSKKDRQNYYKSACAQVTKLTENDTWANLETAVNALAETCLMIAEDYEEQAANLEESPGLLATWEESNPEEVREHFRELADKWSSFDPTEYHDLPELTKEHFMESFWYDVKTWVEDVANAVADEFYTVEME